jgi:hypothetical protein
MSRVGAGLRERRRAPHGWLPLNLLNLKGNADAIF